MGANIVTLVRSALAVITLALFQLSFPFRLAAFLLSILIFYMDSLDGWLARKFNVASNFGALLKDAG
jgi:phosphatidylglycerophosphate synthase